MKRLAIYCGSRPGTDPAFAEAAAQLGRTLAERGIGVVYGGGKRGLMGIVADAALQAGGEVIGVIPQALVDAEVAHRGCTELHVVTTMHERKARMTDLADGFVSLPGGVGTLDELFEALSWAQLGYHAKPSALLNVAGFWDEMVAFLDRVVKAGFLIPQHRANLLVGDSIEELLERMAAWTPGPTVAQVVRSEL